MTWDLISEPVDMGGLIGGGAPDVDHGGLGVVAVDANANPLHPSHPMFIFGVIAGVTFGLIGASTHLRVGPFKVGAEAGKD